MKNVLLALLSVLFVLHGCAIDLSVLHAEDNSILQPFPETAEPELVEEQQITKTEQLPTKTEPSAAPAPETTHVSITPVVANATHNETTTSAHIRYLPSLVKSKSDERTYRRFWLPNGLDVLLVHDLNCTKAAAAMDVNVGYWKDPEDIPGLAHFLEHMLFLGTKKYPKEDSYNGFLSAHGGSSNAYTSMMNTNFYFDVQPDSLEGALDRFAQFFIAPLFTESATGREMKAVNAEHEKNIQSDGWRTFQMMQSLASKQHPFHKFGTGNIQTLGHAGHSATRAALLQFWQTYYHAYNMRVTILGKETLDELEKWAQTMFAAVPSQAHKSNSESLPQPQPVVYEDSSSKVFPAASLPQLIFSQSVKDTRSLMLSWFLPPQTPKYATKSIDYISTLLGSEAKGSLLSILRSKGLATALTAGPDLTTGAFDLFQVSLDLTEKGNTPGTIREIIEQILQYIRLIEEKGVEKWRWQEMGTISAIRFRLKNKEGSSDYVSELASNMGKYNSRDLLTAKYMYKTYDPEGIRQLLSMLSVQTMTIVISSQHPTVNLTQTEQYYGVKFTVMHIPELDKLNKARADDVPDQKLIADEDHRMILPAKNPFIPTSLEYKALESPDWPDRPVIIKEETNIHNSTHGSLRVWFHQDRKFNRPRAQVVCKFWSQEVYATPRDVVLGSLFTKMVSDHFNELAYAAGIAGFTFSFDSDVDGFDLRVSGYDSVLLQFTEELSKFLMLKHNNVSSTIKGFVPLPKRFKLIKDEMALNYRNFVFGQPHVHATYYNSMLSESPHWHISEYLSAIQDIDLFELINWSREIYKDTALECIAHGNLHKQEALDIVDAIVKNVDYGSNAMAYREISSQIQRITQVDGSYQFFLQTPNKDDSNSAVYDYYQYEGNGSLVDDVYVQLLSLVMDKPCFQQLRTVEQLGYIVWSGIDSKEGVNGIRVIVQSPKHDAAYLHSRVSQFMTSTLRTIIRGMPYAKFSEVVKTLITMKEQKSRTLEEDLAKYWYEISSQQYMFDRREKEVAVLKNITQQQFWLFYDDLIGYNGIPSLISVQVNTQKKHNVTSTATSLVEVAAKQLPAENSTDSTSSTDVYVVPKIVTVRIEKETIPCGTYGYVCTPQGDAALPPNTPAPTHPPVYRPADPTCNKSGGKKVYKPRQVSLVNIAGFKDGCCLFPKRKVGSVASFLFTHWK